jgi:hypothetical protein
MAVLHDFVVGDVALQLVSRRLVAADEWMKIKGMLTPEMIANLKNIPGSRSQRVDYGARTRF